MEERDPLRPPGADTFAFATGEVIGGRYRVQRFLAEGGMGEVYEAEDLELHDRIALKVLRADLSRDPTALERFRREIQIARRVTHPNVCRIFDLERHRHERRGDLMLLTMEYLDGETLEQRIRRQGRLPVEEALPLVRQMAEALAAAHRAGVIHRDFKSANVILVPEDISLSATIGLAPGSGTRAVVTDFGLASLSPEAGALLRRVTTTGLVVGTAGYMAPEQAEGHEVSSRADQYALGVVIFEMLTGRLPHDGDSPVSLLLKRVQAPAPSPRLYVPALPESWERTVLRCLERDPAARFASVLDVARALGATVASSETQVVAVKPREAPDEPPPERGRTRALGLTVAALMALLVVVGAGLAWRSMRAKETPRTAVREGLMSVQVTASAGLDLYPSFSPDGSSMVFSSDRTGQFEIYVRQLAAGGREVAITDDGNQNFQPAWSPDGQWIAYHSKKRGGIWVIPAMGGTPRAVADEGSRPAWSPDGRLLAFQSEPLVDLAPNAAPALPPSTVWSVPAAGGEPPRQLTKPGMPPGGHGSPSWHPDGRTLVFVVSDSRNSELWTVSSEGGAPSRLVGDEPTVRDPVYSPDGRHLYYCASPDRENNGIMRLALTGPGPRAKKALGMTSLGLGRIRHLALSRDGQRVAYSALAMSSNLWSVSIGAGGEASGRPRPLTAETGRNSRPSFSPDGSRLAFSKFRPGGNEDVWVVDADGGNLTQVTTSEAFDSRPNWMPDGRTIAFFSNRDRQASLWTVSLDTGKETRILALDADIDSTRLSPDGQLLAFNSRKSGTINVWVLPLSGGEARQVTNDPELMGWPCFSPDGRRIAAQLRRGPDTHVAVVPLEGGEPAILTSAPGTSWPHSFSPDGGSIAFAGGRDGYWNVYTVRVASRSETRLTDFAKLNAYVRYPAWSPRGDRIVFEYAETTGNVWMVESGK